MSVEIVATYENIPTGSMANSTTTANDYLNYSTNFVNFRFKGSIFFIAILNEELSNSSNILIIS